MYAFFDTVIVFGIMQCSWIVKRKGKLVLLYVLFLLPDITLIHSVNIFIKISFPYLCLLLVVLFRLLKFCLAQYFIFFFFCKLPSEFKIKGVKTSQNTIKLDQVSAPAVELFVFVLYCSSNCA